MVSPYILCLCGRTCVCRLALACVAREIVHVTVCVIVCVCTPYTFFPAVAFNFCIVFSVRGDDDDDNDDANNEQNIVVRDILLTHPLLDLSSSARMK